MNRADAAPNAESSQTGDPEPFEQWPEEPIRWSEADRADRVQVVEPPRHAERYDDDPTVRGPAYGPPSDADYGEEPSWEPLPADQTAATDVRYRVRDEYEERERRSSRTPFMVLGFLALGALALFAGATFYGLLGRRADAGNAAVLPTPAASASVAATAAPTGPATTEPPAGSDAPAASATPAFAFADGFAATAEPCLTIPTEPSCAQSGDQINPSNGSVWILVTFDQAQGGDLIGARGVGPDGALIGDASWVVPGAGASNGWVYFGFRVDNLSEGTYDVTVSRNGEPAAVTEFRVQG